MAADNREEMFTTLFCGLLDVTSGTMTYCNCGHNAPLVLRKEASTFETLRVCGPPLGILEDSNYMPRSIALTAGDTRYIDLVWNRASLRVRLVQGFLEVAMATLASGTDSSSKRKGSRAARKR